MCLNSAKRNYMTINQTENTVLLSELRVLLNKVIQQNLAEGLLFSAGTDTSILAYEALKFKPDLKAMTLIFEQGMPEDIDFVKRMVAYLKLDHEFQFFNATEAANTASKVINILKTFDPMQVRHAIPVYIGLTKAKEKRLKSVFTGDGMDELFGYPWLFHLSEKDLTENLQNMWEEMTFSSIPLGKTIGIAVKTPYLDPEFMNFAKKLPLRLKINFEKGTQYGKWLLRKAYEDAIPSEVIWRPKIALEKGTGTIRLQDIFSKKISNKEFSEKKQTYLEKDKVELNDKEQMFYYELFKKQHGSPTEAYPEKEGRQCPKCKGYVKTKIGFCRICGNYPI
jgi:asparagine synthase (glutamine-hydrolysing)